VVFLYQFLSCLDSKRTSIELNQIPVKFYSMNGENNINAIFPYVKCKSLPYGVLPKKNGSFVRGPVCGRLGPHSQKLADIGCVRRI
jgi:hypothetical protein